MPFDRDSAVLQLLRARDQVKIHPMVRRIARIDLAGQERDLAPHHGFFAMRLLRGMPRR